MAKKATTKAGLFTQIIQNGKKVFFGVYKEIPTAETVAVTKDEKTKHYEMYEELSGKLNDFYIFDKKISGDRTFEMLVVNLKASDDTIESVSMPFESNFAASFIQRLESIDKSKEVTLKVMRIINEDKTKLKGVDCFNEMLLPYQIDANGKLSTLTNPYRKDGEKKMPEFAKSTKKVKGVEKTTYDTSEYLEFMREIVKSLNANYKVANEAEQSLKTAKEFAAANKMENVNELLESELTNDLHTANDNDLPFD